MSTPDQQACAPRKSGPWQALIKTACAVGAIASTVVALPSFATPTGGSDYGWYQVTNCNREPYGVIANYNTASATINQQLATMIANGQRRLRIPIYFGHGINSGTVMDSTGGNLSPQNRQNLTNLLAAIKNAGFAEIEVGFFPVGAMNDPTSWSQYNETYYQENWNLIYNLHSIIASAGILYRIDLQNEGAPTTGQTALLQYDQHLWNDYNFVFGKNDTVGVSIIPEQNRLQNLPAVYGPSQYGSHGAPYLFDLHFYDHTTTNFINTYNIMHGNYPGIGWILGEAFYNDPVQADTLNQSIAQTGQTIFYLTQWPLTYQRSCADVDVVPLDFSNYLSRGF